MNLNKPFDFALATASAPQALLDAFLRDKTEWHLLEGSYRGGRKSAREVVFHVFISQQDYQAGVPRITDQEGRRKAKYNFPYKDGQTTDDLGARGNNIDVEIVFHGPTYQLGMNRLIAEMNDRTPGTLIHPVRGVITAAAEDWTVVHAADATQAAMLQVRFTSHDFDTFASGVMTSIKTPRGALLKALSAIQQIANAIAAIRQIVATLQSIAVSIQEKMQEIYTGYLSLAADARSVFGMTGSDLAAFMPVQQGGIGAIRSGGLTAGGVNPAADASTFGTGATTITTAGQGGLRTTVGGFIIVSTRFTSVVSPIDPFANVPINLLGDVAREAIALAQLVQNNATVRAMVAEVVGDIDSAIDTIKNKITDPQSSSAAVEALLSTRSTLLETAADMLDVITAGQQNGRPVIISYAAPHDMSIREVAFVNGLTPQDGDDIAALNPDLESVNVIDKGTVLLVPTFL